MKGVISQENMSSGEFAEWIQENLIGETLVSVSDEQLVTESGWEVALEPNIGCDCGSGTAAIWLENNPKKLGVITGSGVEQYTDPDDKYNEDLFKLFIYMEGIPTLEFSGDDGYGNGYYGYGFYVSVRNVKKMEE